MKPLSESGLMFPGDSAEFLQGKPPLKSLFGSQWARQRQQPCWLRGSAQNRNGRVAAATPSASTATLLHQLPTESSSTGACWSHCTCIWIAPFSWQGWGPAVPVLARPSGFWTLTQKRDVASGARMLPVAQASAGPSEL
ncbi:unnamed protein product [Gadus morhua 'NCC']